MDVKIDVGRSWDRMPKSGVISTESRRRKAMGTAAGSGSGEAGGNAGETRRKLGGC